MKSVRALPERRRSAGGRHAAEPTAPTDRLRPRPRPQGRRAAARPASPLASLASTSLASARHVADESVATPAVQRAAKGAVVTALVVGLTATVASATTAEGPEQQDRGLVLRAEAARLRAQNMAEARDEVAGAALTAVAVAEAAKVKASAAKLDDERVAELEAATERLNQLLADVPEVARSADVSRSEKRGTSESATTKAPAAPTPSATPAAPATPPATQAPATDDTLAALRSATAAPTPEAGAAQADEADEATASAAATPEPGATSPTTTDVATDEPTALADQQLEEVAPEDVVLPVADGPEDEVTQQLREAAQALLALTAQLADDTEQAEEAAAKAAAKKAAERKKAEAAAREKAAEERAAAQRAAWKRSLLGYANGQIPSSALCDVSFDSAVQLRCDAAEALDELNTAFRQEFGHDIAITDSYRSYAQQVVCRATKGFWCAQPGTSNHGGGVAVDLSSGIDSFGSATHRWMVAHAHEYGWVHPDWARAGGSKPEPWHWEYVG